MNRVSVTIVDVMAFLVPGVVLLFGLLLMPVPEAWLTPLNDSLLARIPLLRTPWAAGACWVLAAYVLGFLLRLVSIQCMNLLTSRRWVARVELQATQLAETLRALINDPPFMAALDTIARSGDKRGVSACAPYFSYAKRVIRTRPELFVEAERLEAEVRFAAGLFIPFVVLAIDGGMRIPQHLAAALVLLTIGVAGALTVFRTFPERRVKEVFYDQLLAVIALRQPAEGKPTSQSSS